MGGGAIASFGEGFPGQFPPFLVEEEPDDRPHVRRIGPGAGAVPAVPATG